MHLHGCTYRNVLVNRLPDLSFLLVDPDPDKRSRWRAALAGHWPRARVTEADDEGAAVAAVRERGFDAIVGGAVHLLARLQEERPDPLRILVAPSVSFDLARDAINLAGVDGLLAEKDGADALVGHLTKRLRPSF